MRTVLVVDDEPSLRLLCRVNLELEGYRVLEARTLARRARARRRVVDVVAARRPRRRRQRPRPARRARGAGPAASASCCCRVRARSSAGTARAGRRRARQAVLRSSRSSSRGRPARGVRYAARRVSAAAVRTPAEYEERLARYLFERSEEAPRRARRREGDLGAGGDRRALPRSLHAPRSSTRCAMPRRPRAGDERELRLPAAQDLRGRAHRRRARRARGRAREPRSSPRGSSWRGEELPLRTAQAKLAVLPGVRATATSSATLCERRERAASTTSGASCSRPARRSRPSSRASRDPVARQRGGEGDLAARARARAGRREPRVRGAPTSGCASAGSSGCSGPERDDGPDLEPHGLPAPALAARGDVHEGARGRGLRRRRCGGSASTSSASPGSGSTSTTGRRSRRAPA